MNSFWCMKFAVAALLIAGCDDKKTQPNPRVDERPKPAVAEDTPRLNDPPKTPTGDTPKTISDGNPKTATPGAALTVREQATTLLTDLKSSIDRGKFADADAQLKQLDAMKDKLPRDLADRLESLRKAYKSWPTGAH